MFNGVSMLQHKMLVFRVPLKVLTPNPSNCKQEGLLTPLLGRPENFKDSQAGKSSTVEFV